MNIELIPTAPDGLIATLDGWFSRAGRIEQTYAALVEDFHETERRRFRDEGPGWRPLADSTQQERARLGYGPAHPILHRTGSLEDSLTTSDSPDSVFRPEIDGFFVGTKTSYAQYHQVEHVEGRPPTRVLVELGAADRVRWYAILGRFLAHGELGTVETTVTGAVGGMDGPG